MEIIYNKCGENGNCLITVNEIGEKLKKKMPLKQIESIINSLELDDYFDVVFSERKGKPILCVNLHVKGISYKREMVQFKRDIYKKLIFAFISAIATFIFGRLLFFIFK